MATVPSRTASVMGPDWAKCDPVFSPPNMHPQSDDNDGAPAGWAGYGLLPCRWGTELRRAFLVGNQQRPSVPISIADSAGYSPSLTRFPDFLRRIELAVEPFDQQRLIPSVSALPGKVQVMWLPCGQVSPRRSALSRHEACTCACTVVGAVSPQALPDRVEDVAADVARPAGAEVLPAAPDGGVIDRARVGPLGRGAQPVLPVERRGRRLALGRARAGQSIGLRSAPAGWSTGTRVWRGRSGPPDHLNFTASRSPMPEACCVPSCVTTPARRAAWVRARHSATSWASGFWP